MDFNRKTGELRMLDNILPDVSFLVQGITMNHPQEDAGR